MISDALLGACVPIAAGGVLWTVKQFIKTTVGERGPKGDDGPRGKDGLSMSVRQYKEFSDFLITQLNGRYLLAAEARELFSSLENKVESITCGKLGCTLLTHNRESEYVDRSET